METQRKIAFLHTMPEGVDLTSLIADVVTYTDYSIHQTELAQMAACSHDPEAFLLIHLYDNGIPFRVEKRILRDDTKNLAVLELGDRIAYFFDADGEIENQYPMEDCAALVAARG